MFLYQKSDGQIYLNVYKDELVGYQPTLSSTSLSFPAQAPDTVSSAKQITVTNNSGNSLTLNSINISGEFTNTTNCGSTLAASASCTIDVKFAPTSTGTKSGKVEITVDGGSTPRSVNLTGTCEDLKLETVSFSCNSVTDKCTLNGKILEIDNNNTPTQHGFVWNSVGSPSITDNKNELGAKSSTGTYSSELSNMTSPPYYVRAYFTDANGTYYGNELIIYQSDFIADTDGDGVADSSDNCPDDSNYDQSDYDNDGLGDICDDDDDNDGIPDSEEGTGDSDGDGLIDSVDDDSDNDGILDKDESSTDGDGDGLSNAKDKDSDGDGIPDAAEGSGDTDGDGIPDYLDQDSDGDGISDAIEGQTTEGFQKASGKDTDGDGIDDAYDSDNGGSMPLVDTDGDGTPDYLDTDSDGDGTPDATEAFDLDDDGVADVVPSNQDTNGNGIDDAFESYSTPSNINASWRRSTESVSCDEFSIASLKTLTIKRGRVLKARVIKFANSSAACGGSRLSDEVKKATKSFRGLRLLIKRRFPDTAFECPDGTPEEITRTKVRTRIKKYARRLFRMAKNAKLKALQVCPHRPKTAGDRRKRTDDYRDDLYRTIKRLPDSYWEE